MCQKPKLCVGNMMPGSQKIKEFLSKSVKFSFEGMLNTEDEMSDRGKRMVFSSSPARVTFPTSSEGSPLIRIPDAAGSRGKKHV